MAGTPTGVNVARLRAVDRPEVVSAFLGARVDVTVQWGQTAEQRTELHGRAVAVASVFGEPGVMVLVLHADDGRTWALKLTRLARIARAEGGR
ncbi:hypothetical protein ACIBTV_27470 [Micromonospora sp. NPDC049366]|uniref:hypothetical protein n=1 Tax=Micromonospora sp. NPDC049366 TaxID=3364271 RepID=UPI0037910290